MLDRVTVLGLAAMFAIVLGVMLTGTGTAVGVFWQTPSILLVLGGSALATLISLPQRRVGSVAGVLRSAFYEDALVPEEVVQRIVALAEVARRHGMLALEEPAKALPDAFLKRAVQMAVDGMDAATIESVMRSEMEAIDLRHTYGKSMLETMGRFSPVFGMIGTLIGLVVMLGHMSEPARIGPGMAVALLTTLYGLVIANVVCLPLARKLAGRSSDELMIKTMMLKGVLAIQSGDHPRVVEQKLRAYVPSVPPAKRTREKSAQSATTGRGGQAGMESIDASGGQDTEPVTHPSRRGLAEPEREAA